MLVSNIFYFHPYLVKIPILTYIIQRVWNHQLPMIFIVFNLGILEYNPEIPTWYRAYSSGFPMTGYVGIGGPHPCLSPDEHPQFESQKAVPKGNLRQIDLKLYPRDPITLSDDDWGVYSPSKCKVFRFHYHSQKVIGSLGIVVEEEGP